MNKFDFGWIFCLATAFYLWFIDTVPFAVPWGWVFFVVACVCAEVAMRKRGEIR